MSKKNQNDAPVKPEKDIPAKPDKDPDPTKKKIIKDPEKNDPTRIEEPKKNDPTRIDQTPATIKNKKSTKQLKQVKKQQKLDTDLFHKFPLKQKQEHKTNITRRNKKGGYRSNRSMN